jgi:ketosteroid isomerase-like protein
MSQADIEMLRAGYEAFSREGWDAVLGQAPPDFELKTADRATSPGVYRGPDAVRQFVEDFFAPFEETSAEPEEFFERGERIAVFVRIRSRPKGSTAIVENRVGHVWTIRDGQAVGFEIYPEREKALEAIGVAPEDASA